MDRPFDIILWGATGFTGRPAALYLQRMYAAKGLIRWAIAGRNRAKLEAVKQEIGDPELEIFIVPGGDKAAADTIARQTKVIAATVAPGAQYNTEMVLACIENGTHYCDLCGELHWLRRMLDQYDDLARKRATKIINCCGFDSIPSEYMVQVIQKHAKQELGEYCSEITNCFESGTIAVSGGSFASGKGVMEAVANDPVMADMIANPYSLNPPDQRSGPLCPDIEKTYFDRRFQQYIMPFPLGQINARIIRRTHVSMGLPFGNEFTYVEGKLAGKGFKNRVAAELETFVTRLFVEANPNSRMGTWLHRLGPKPGTGPSDEQIAKNGPFSYNAVGTTATGSTIHGWMFSRWDPGHGGTSAMLGDSAYCLAMKQEEIERETNNKGGFLTPYLAFGEVLQRHLKDHAGVEWGIGKCPYLA